MRPVDSHCHLDFEQFEEDREKVIERARKKLEFVVNAGSNLERNRKVLELEERHPEFIVANLGLHPTYTDHFSELEQIKTQIRREEPAAIGEIGLDYHHVTEEELRQRQEEVFREMLELAEELEKPVVIHSREAEEKVVEILEEYSIPEVMLHCFNGTPELAEKAAEKGMKIGVTTQVLYSTRVQNIVREIKVEDILLETDSPFLYRGERNQPLNVRESAEKIGELKDLEKSTVTETTTENANQTFN